MYPARRPIDILVQSTSYYVLRTLYFGREHRYLGGEGLSTTQHYPYRQSPGVYSNHLLSLGSNAECTCIGDDGAMEVLALLIAPG